MINLVPLVTAQAVAFWVLAPIAVIGALGMVLSRKPVHSALSLALMMISLAGPYASLDAPFLFVVSTPTSISTNRKSIRMAPV